MANITTKDIYQTIVDGFKEQLKNGINPFTPVGEIKNISTLRSYTGFNKWYLSSMVREKEYKTGNFATYKQIIEAGGQVRKGEKSYPVFFWGTIYRFGDVSLSANSESDALKKARKKRASITASDFSGKNMFIKHFSVFNIDQADNIEFKDDAIQLNEPIEQLLNASGAIIAEANIAMYDITIDTISTPSEFDNGDEELILKALIESTGHEDRLGRSFEYAEEELICIIGSSFLAAVAKVDEINFDSSMVEHWLNILDERPMFLYKASSQAQKACDILLNKVEIANFVEIAKAS